MNMKRIICNLFIAVMVAMLASPQAGAQIVTVDGQRLNTDSVRHEFDKGPYFGLYKDNYFIFGPAIGQKITRANTNAKFQVSIAQKLTKSTLPGTHTSTSSTPRKYSGTSSRNHCR